MSDNGPSTLDVSIAIIPKVGGMISLLSCSLLMRDVSIKWHTKKSVSLTSVIVFFISMVDWLYSFFGAFLSTWMMPADSGHHLAAGNINTCTAQGFITAFAIFAHMSYYAELMITCERLNIMSSFCSFYLRAYTGFYFYSLTNMMKDWIIVHFGWTETRMKKIGIRLAFILPPIILSLVHAIPPLFFGMYNPGLFSCFITTYPLNCHVNPDVECKRGAGAHEYSYIFLAWTVLCNLIIVIFVCMLIHMIYKQERKVSESSD